MSGLIAFCGGLIVGIIDVGLYDIHIEEYFILSFIFSCIVFSACFYITKKRNKEISGGSKIRINKKESEAKK